MPHEFQFFEDFISDYFISSKHNNLAPANFKTAKDNLKAQTLGASGRILHNAQACTTPHQLELYVHCQQTALTAVTDKLEHAMHFRMEDLEDIFDEPSISNLSKLLYRHLQELMFTLRSYFSKYFNFHAGLPILFRRLAAHEMRSEFSWIKQKFLANGVGEGLLQIIEEPLNKLGDAFDSAPTSWQRYFYLKNLIIHLYETDSSEPPDRSKALIEMLLKLNFNSDAFYAFSTRSYADKITAFPYTSTKKQVIASLLSKLHRSFHLDNAILNPGYPNLRDLLILWLEDELAILDGKHPSLKGITAHEPLPKIQTTLNAAQLAHILKLMIETGVYINLTPKEGSEVYCSTYINRAQTLLSSEKLRQRYYTPDTPTASSVRELLLKMIHHSKKISP